MLSTSRLVTDSTDGDVIWTEWEMGGTRVDGVPQQLRGVIIWGVSGDRLDWSRFYLEPVDAGEDGVEGAIGASPGRRRRPPTRSLATPSRPSCWCAS